MKKTFISLGIILGIGVCCGGIVFLWDVIKTIAYSFYSLFVAFLPFLDLEQPLLCKLISILIIQMLCGLGFWVSHKTEVTIGKIISTIADVVATVLLLVA